MRVDTFWVFLCVHKSWFYLNNLAKAKKRDSCSIEKS